MALLVAAIGLSTAGFFGAAFIKRTYSPGSSSGMYFAMRAVYFAGWAFAGLVGLLLVFAIMNLLGR